MASKNLPKGKYRGKPLTPEKKEQIVQTYALCGEKTKTADLCDVSIKTVYNVLAERPPKEVQEARNKTMVELAERVSDKAIQAIEHISPEKLEKSTASQLAVVSGIMLDKLGPIERARQDLLESNRGIGGMPLPDDANAMMQMLVRKIKSMEVLRVELRDEEGDKALQQARELLDRAQRDALKTDEIPEAEYEVLDLDNPGSGDAGESSPGSAE